MEDEVTKALEDIPSYKQINKDVDESGHTAFCKLRQVERAYEQLQNSGVDISDQLRERRYQILETVFECVYDNIEDVYEEVKSRQEIREMSIPALKRAVGLLEEYVQKIDPNSPSLEDNRWLE
jgi:hypothetical protein